MGLFAVNSSNMLSDQMGQLTGTCASKSSPYASGEGRAVCVGRVAGALYGCKREGAVRRAATATVAQQQDQRIVTLSSR